MLACILLFKRLQGCQCAWRQAASAARLAPAATGAVTLSCRRHTRLMLLLLLLLLVLTALCLLLLQLLVLPQQ
jgi:hypothetical protein